MTRNINTTFNVQAVYVGGTGRCGSNLLKQIMTQHSDVCALPFEPRYVIDPDGIIDFLCGEEKNWSPFNTSHRIARLEKFLNRVAKRTWVDELSLLTWKTVPGLRRLLTKPSYSAWQLDKVIPGFSKRALQLVENLKEISFPASWCGASSFSSNYNISFGSHSAKADVPRLLADFVNANIAEFAGLSNSSIYLDDSTFCILHCEEILSLDPTAKFIHLIRDPRDVVASYVKQSWTPGSLYDAVGYYMSVIARCVENLDRQPSENQIVVKFEELVCNYDETVERIEKFTGLDFDDCDNKIRLKSSVIGKWKEQIRPDDLALLAPLKKFIDKFEYE